MNWSLGNADVSTNQVWRAILPTCVRFVEATREMWNQPLRPAEYPDIHKCTRKRREEFQAGRAAARQALFELGIGACDIARGKDREPSWPPGVVGSITHSDSYCVAAAARSSAIGGLGIDTELFEKMDPNLARQVFTDNERKRYGSEMETEKLRRILTITFSAKESFFKAWFPATGIWLDFTDVEVDLGLSTGLFAIVAPKLDEPLFSFARRCIGRFGVVGDKVLTVTTFPPPYADCDRDGATHRGCSAHALR